jgi:hypothetical protein
MMTQISKNEASYIDRLLEKEYLKLLFPNCVARIQGNILYAEFIFKDVDFKDDYHIKILYESRNKHKVFITHPQIVPSVEIHMYPDASLCLYYPPDISPFRRLWIGKDLIPLAMKWVVNYELWLLNGYVWKGKEAPGHKELLLRIKNQVK